MKFNIWLIQVAGEAIWFAIFVDEIEMVYQMENLKVVTHGTTFVLQPFVRKFKLGE